MQWLEVFLIAYLDMDQKFLIVLQTAAVELRCMWFALCKRLIALQFCLQLREVRFLHEKGLNKLYLRS